MTPWISNDSRGTEPSLGLGGRDGVENGTREGLVNGVVDEGLPRVAVFEFVGAVIMLAITQPEEGLPAGEVSSNVIQLGRWQRQRVPFQISHAKRGLFYLENQMPQAW